MDKKQTNNSTKKSKRTNKKKKVMVFPFSNINQLSVSVHTMDKVVLN